jgi:small-conductance mechanosensitive channel
MIYELLLFTHLIGLALFLMAHGAAVFLSVSLGRERAPERLRAMLDLSMSSLVASYAGLLLLIASGVTLGFMGQFWSAGWIWASLLVLIGMMLFMMYMGMTYFSKIRRAVGLLPYRRTHQVELGPEASPEDIEKLLTSARLPITAVVGGLGLLVLIGLMVLKPF